MANKDIGLVLTDITTMFAHFEDITREEAIAAMNGGPCAVIASISGYIIKNKFKLDDLFIRNNSVHIWVGQGNKDYDTIFPEGYKGKVADVWGVADKNFCQDPVGEEVNKCYWDWGYISIYRAMCERWGVSEPDFLPSYIAGAQRMTKGSEVKKRKSDMESRYLSALRIPLPKSVKPTGLTPAEL